MNDVIEEIDEVILSKIRKIKKSISELYLIDCDYIKEIVLSNISKDELKIYRRYMGFKCSYRNLGYFSFMIEYFPKNNQSKNPRMFFGI